MSLTVINGAYGDNHAQDIMDDAKEEQPQLSEAAQDLLVKLRANYSGMDFMAADYEKWEIAKKNLSHGTKDISVLFSGEELERMVLDETCEQEYMRQVQSALDLTEQINREWSLEPESCEEDGKSEILKIGILFHEDGAKDIFADLGEPRECRKERLKQRAAACKPWKPMGMKRATVWADSMDTLVEKIREVDWNSVKIWSMPGLP